jgi:two-component system, NarL family, sensor histidine kinase UhpB
MEPMTMATPDRLAPDTQGEVAGLEGGHAWRRSLRRQPWRSPPPSLFWQVFLVNAVLLIAAAVVLAVSPATVSFPVTRHQVVVLGLGLLAVLTANALLLHISLRPLRRLVRLMRRIDLLLPGQRLRAGGARELRTVIETFNQMLDRLELERQSSSSRSVGGLEDERRWLATELHDQIGQGLTAQLFLLKNAIEDASPEVAARLVEVRELAHENLDEVRRIARQLRPTALDDLGLGYALDSLVDAFERSGSFEFVRKIELEPPRLAPAVELTLYRIAQEALTNAVRHADAGRVEIELAAIDEGRRVWLGVRDDGRGMVYAAELESGGIRGMRERALAAEADFEIRSEPGSGTTVSVSVPVLRP